MELRQPDDPTRNKKRTKEEYITLSTSRVRMTDEKPYNPYIEHDSSMLPKDKSDKTCRYKINKLLKRFVWK